MSLIDFEGLWFPLAGSVPRCTDMITWLGLPKTVDAEWVPKRAEALQALPSCLFKQRMRYRGVEHTTALRVQFGCIGADHHHLWSECKQKGCVACPWLNKHGVKDLFLQKGGSLNQVLGPISFRVFQT